MLYAHKTFGSSLGPLAVNEPLDRAIWIDLYRPLDSQVALVEALDVKVPTLADMEEIEMLNRIYRQGDVSYMTAVLPGQLPDGKSTAMPVTFILTPDRLVTVRHHAPRPFYTYPPRAGLAPTDPDCPDGVFLGLVDDIVAYLADMSEGAGYALEEVSADVFSPTSQRRSAQLERALQRTGAQAEVMSRVRLGLLSLGRVLAFHNLMMAGHPGHRGTPLRQNSKAILRDIQSLEVHADFLSTRVQLIVDATMGMINLAQNSTMRILSVVTALFLPPTLIASIYGMNFDHMPELHWRYGFVWALGLMVASAAGTWILARLMKWL